ncbi:hypothetical protein BH09SUM1_BH09SUM1_32850 [soil metagenome]
MSFDLEKIIAHKKEKRCPHAALPVAEKHQMLNVLRERERSQSAAPHRAM